jgi:outer membrane protein assembly factor BamA
MLSAVPVDHRYQATSDSSIRGVKGPPQQQRGLVPIAVPQDELGASSFAVAQIEFRT